MVCEATGVRHLMLHWPYDIILMPCGIRGSYFWQSYHQEGPEGNPDGKELHKANSAFLTSYTTPKVALLPGAFVPAP